MVTLTSMILVVRIRAIRSSWTSEDTEDGFYQIDPDGTSSLLLATKRTLFRLSRKLLTLLSNSGLQLAGRHDFLMRLRAV